MDWNALFNYLGAGGGLVVLLKWISGVPSWYRKNRMAKNNATRKIQDGQDHRITELYEFKRYAEDKISHLEACVTKLVYCPVYDKCPARILVQDYKRKYFYRPSGQPVVAKKGFPHARDNPVGHDGAGDPDGQPPPSA